MISEDYVSHETAKLLKEKGFDEPLHTYYINAVQWMTGKKHRLNMELGTNACIMPTIQMAMKWLRYHNWIISVEPKEFLHDLVVESWSYKIWADATLEVNMSETYQTYNDACEAAIKYCLKNLT